MRERQVPWESSPENVYHNGSGKRWLVMISRAGGLRPILCATLFAPVLLCAAAGWCDRKAPRSRPATRAAAKPVEPSERPDPYAATLKELAITPDAGGIGEFLRALHPSAAGLKRAEALIRQLGSAVWQQREAATRELLKMPSIPIEMLRQAEKDPDIEVRARAQHILGHRSRRKDQVLHAVLGTIAARKLRGLSPGVLKAIPLFANEYLLAAARKALGATARAQDADLLRRALEGKNVQVRIAAAGAMTKLLGPRSPREVYPLLKDREPRVALAAARGLADCGDRKSLAALWRLLSAENVGIRVSSAATLRALTARNFHFAAHAAPADRAKAVAAWKKWIATEGAAAELHFPLKTTASGVGDLHGNTLIAYGNRNKVEELTPAGKVVWTSRVQGVWAAEKLPNGNVLVAGIAGGIVGGKVQEIDRKGKVVWEFGVNCLGIKPLATGNVLVADFRGRRAIEVTRAKKIVWTHKTKIFCTDVQRLANGNTLVTSLDRVEEVTPAGKVVWRWTGPAQVFGARRLENGNTLIAILGDAGVIEITPTKKVVWQYVVKAVDAFRLPNGNTLITTNNKVLEVTPDKKVIWQRAGLSYGSARR